MVNHIEKEFWIHLTLNAVKLINFGMNQNV